MFRAKIGEAEAALLKYRADIAAGGAPNGDLIRHANAAERIIEAVKSGDREGALRELAALERAVSDSFTSQPASYKKLSKALRGNAKR